MTAHLPPTVDRGPSVASLLGQWSGEDVFVVGTGTSLIGFDYHRLEGKRTIALNDAASLFRPSIWLFSDHDLWQKYRGVEIPADQVVVCQEMTRDHLRREGGCKWVDQVIWFTRTPDMHKANVDKRDADPLVLADTARTDPANLLCVHRTVATGGITLAWKLGARRIFLLGVDAYRLAQSYYSNGKRHRKADKIIRDVDGIYFESRHDSWVEDMRNLRLRLNAAGVYREPFPGSGVYNLSPMSKIDSWQKVDMNLVLPQ